MITDRPYVTITYSGYEHGMYAALKSCVGNRAEVIDKDGKALSGTIGSVRWRNPQGFTLVLPRSGDVTFRYCDVKSVKLWEW